MSLLLTIAEAAQELRMSEGFIEREIREGRLLVRKLGRKTRIERSALEAWISRLPYREIAGTPQDQGGSPWDCDLNQAFENTPLALVESPTKVMSK